MARYLSREWFDEVVAASGPDAAGGRDLVLEQVVLDTPDGDVRYRVAVGDGTVRLIAPPHPAPPAAPDGAGNGTAGPSWDAGAADLTFTSDWATATALAQGVLSAQTAIMEGRLRVRGSLTRISGQAPRFAGLDPVPEEVRSRTTY
jgi:SCP-2 sterol transfer family